MKEIIKKAIKWFSESHRWQHLVLATVIGIWADSWYCTLLTGAGVAGALEYFYLRLFVRMQIFLPRCSYFRQNIMLSSKK